MSFIAKLQKSIAPAGRVLIYNESKSIQHEFDLTDEYEKLFGDKLKLYAKCKLAPNNEIQILTLVKARAW